MRCSFFNLQPMLKHILTDRYVMLMYVHKREHIKLQVQAELPRRSNIFKLGIHFGIGLQ